jgi:hypothetical protein
MSDDKQMAGGQSQDRKEQDYAVQLFAQEAGISIEQAREIMDRFGHDREAMMREAGMMIKQMA